MRLVNFKRFTDLTLDGIPPAAKAVLIVGPNGCGKSSVFDGFEQLSTSKPQRVFEDWYLRKHGGKSWLVTMTDHSGRTFSSSTAGNPMTLSYIRSPYRYTGMLSVSQLAAAPRVEEDVDRPKRLIDVDQRLVNNYQRMFSKTVSELFRGELDELLGRQIREKYVAQLNDALSKLLDIRVSDIGDPIAGRGQLFFSKGAVQYFPYANLSAGEKEVVDLVLDLILKASDFRDTVYCIDEPDLHINTAIQSKLFEVILELIPESSQVWIATHSIGFVRAALRNGSAVVFDFSGVDFDQPQVLVPIGPNKRNLRSVFSVALDDLVDVVVPSTIVVVEGETADRDARFYTTVFDDRDVEFVHARDKNSTKVATLRLMEITKRGLSPKDVRGLVDRDGLNDEERRNTMTDYLRILTRYSLENYVIDPEVVRRLCDRNYEEALYRAFLSECVSRKLPAIQEDIRKYRERDSVTKRKPDDHPLLKGDFMPTPESLSDWLPLVPGKLMVGDVLQWIRQNSRSSRVTNSTSTEEFIQLAATYVRESESVRQELEDVVFG